MSSEITDRYAIFIKATPEAVWEAVTAPRFTTQYFPGGALESDWQRGSRYTRTAPDGSVMYDGTVLESDPPRRLVQSVTFRNPAFAGHKELTIAWDVEPAGEACRVTISHFGSASDAQLLETVTGHCPHMMSGLKTLLETGAPLHIDEPAASGAHA